MLYRVPVRLPDIQDDLSPCPVSPCPGAQCSGAQCSGAQWKAVLARLALVHGGLGIGYRVVVRRALG